MLGTPTFSSSMNLLLFRHQMYELGNSLNRTPTILFLPSQKHHFLGISENSLPLPNANVIESTARHTEKIFSMQ